ncbi:MAG TPA: hypothetical protein VHE30_09725 [Polyangiaceae bacterium]|nr:hypothetical protein [Polyangiaceae bacterium]
MKRLNQRARTDCRVRTWRGSLVSSGRGVELSPTGIVVDRARPIDDRDRTTYVEMEILLPERSRPLHAVARPVWSFGTQQAFKFVVMSDVDRLNLAEHVDIAAIRERILH